MSVINCICGARLESDSADSMFVAYRAHADAAHADLTISDADIRKTLATTEHMTAWDGARRPLGNTIDVRPLTPERAGDFLRFFDRDAFMDNPEWSDCYCLFYDYAGDDWESATSEANRAAKEALIVRGEAQGYLAYNDGRPVGWCHAAPRANLPGLDRIPDFRCDGDPSEIGAIVCFVVAAPYRRQGLARRLLDAACDGLRAQGFATVEAYPARVARSDARDYHGRLDMYLKSGFVLHRETDNFAVVRKSL